MAFPKEIFKFEFEFHEGQKSWFTHEFRRIWLGNFRGAAGVRAFHFTQFVQRKPVSTVTGVELFRRRSEYDLTRSNRFRLFFNFRKSYNVRFY